MFGIAGSEFHGSFLDVWSYLDVWGSAPNAQKDKTSKKDQLEKILKTSNPSENGERCENNESAKQGYHSSLILQLWQIKK